MNKTTSFATVAGITIAALSGCTPAPDNPEQRATAGDPYETVPVIDAYYEGGKVWFIHTDVSDEQMARRLTQMVE